MKVVVTGAAGFVGGHTVAALIADGHKVVGLLRGMVPAELQASAGAEYFGGVDVTDPSTLAPEYFDGADAVVHLVGIIAEQPPLQTFARIHVQGTRNVIGAAHKAGVKRIVYLSAIGAKPDAAAEYSRTKYAAEQIVQASGVAYTILRPSIILGKNGEFAAQMKDLARYGGLPFKLPVPLIPVPGSGDNLFQPLYVDDLTTCIAQSVSGPQAENKIIEVGGATRISFNQVIKAFETAEQIKKPLLHLPLDLLTLVAPIVEKLPKPPFTGDQLKNLRIDNVADLEPMRAAFGFEPIGLSGRDAKTLLLSQVARVDYLNASPALGNCSLATSSQYFAAASLMVWPMFAYCRTCRIAGGSPLSPNMSEMTSTWPSQCGPEPMPIVGMVSVSVISFAKSHRDQLKHDRERARLLNGCGVGEDTACGVFATSLNAQAGDVHRLRRQADMAHDRNYRHRQFGG